MTAISRPVAWIERPVALARLSEFADEMKTEHGSDLVLRHRGSRFIVFTPGDDCSCQACTDALAEFLDPVTAMQSFMVLCADCGNKRCPKAANHENACTGSNEPGQEGSNYP